MLNSNQTPPKLGFRQRHPVLFLFGILITAMALSTGALAFFSSSSTSWDEEVLAWPDSEKLGVVYVEGAIENSERMVAFLRKLRKNDKVKGVLLRVNSPGGAFGPSQEINRAVARLAAKKPVVASFGSVAASGGYYVACPAKVIYALPGTLTGSIGVRSQYTTVTGLTEKIGLTFHNFATGKLKDAGSPYRPMTEEDKVYIENLIGQLHALFVGDVAAARKLDPSKIDALQGRALTGAAAKEAGLVDKIGGQEDALDELKRLTGVTKKNPSLIKGPKKETSTWEELMSKLGVAFINGMRSAQPDSTPRAE